MQNLGLHPTPTEWKPLGVGVQKYVFLTGSRGDFNRIHRLLRNSGLRKLLGPRKKYIFWDVNNNPWSSTVKMAKMIMLLTMMAYPGCRWEKTSVSYRISLWPSYLCITFPLYSRIRRRGTSWAVTVSQITVTLTSLGCPTLDGKPFEGTDIGWFALSFKILVSGHSNAHIQHVKLKC